MTMAHRYFLLARGGAVFRMDIDDEAETLETFELGADGWKGTELLMRYIYHGDVDLDELDAHDAARLIPGEFRQ